MTDLGGNSYPYTPEPSPDERLWAMGAQLGGLAFLIGPGVLNWLIPLVIWLIYKEKSRFVAIHAMQSLVFQIVLMVLYAISGILTLVCIGFFLLAVVFVFHIAYCIIGGIRANSGLIYEYPGLSSLTR